MDEYRKLAHQKYLQNKKDETEFNQMKIKMDNEYENMTFSLIERTIKSIEENINSNINCDINCDIDNDIVILMETICDNFDFFERRKQLNRLKEIVIKFVNTINSITQSKKINLRNINLLSNNFNIIFDMLNLHISIEKMDTSEDEIYAYQIQEQLYQNEFNQIEINEFIENEFIENEFIENEFIENEFIENEFTENDGSDVEYIPDDE